MNKISKLFRTVFSRDTSGSQKINILLTTIERHFFKSRVNWIKTLYFNLRSMPLRVAIKLPVYIYCKTELRDLSGTVEFESDIARGMVHIGDYSYRSQGKTRIYNKGVIRFGKQVLVSRGCELAVFEKGRLELDAFTFLAENSMAYVYHYVKIGEHTYIAYHSQLLDTDFHYTVNTETGEVKDRTSSIILGKYNWIGNKTTIKKGTITPDYTIVAASNSLLNKDYRKSIPEYSIIGGSPAKLLTSGFRRVFNFDTEAMLVEHFTSSSNPYFMDMHQTDLDAFCVKNRK